MFLDSFEKHCGLYKIVNLDSSDYYYGQSQDIYKRYKNHLSTLGRGLHENPKLQNSWSAHPDSIFIMFVVCLLPLEELEFAEQQLLVDHVGRQHCFNTALDSSAPRRGAKMSPRTLRLMKKRMQGWKPSAYMIQRVKETLTGRSLPEETKKKIGDANRGSNNFFFGKKGSKHSRFGVKWSRETRFKMEKVFAEMRCKKVIQLNKDGRVIRSYPSIAKAMQMTGIAHQNISTCCRQKTKTAGGYIWRFQ